MQKVCFEIVFPSSQFVFSFDGKQVVDEQSTIHNHYGSNLGVFDGSPFVVGSGNPENKEVEHFRKSSWSSVGQFPFVSEYINGYSTLTVKNEVYIFG